MPNGLSVSLEIDEALPSRPEIEIAIFRIFQELMTNILRHAQAEHVSVELYEREGRLVLAVEDDGLGFNPSETAEGAGITGMRERTALVNGSIRLDSEPGRASARSWSRTRSSRSWARRGTVRRPSGWPPGSARTCC